MSTRADIGNDRLIYTCNCGWVDKGHADPRPASRPNIGAVALWNQLIQESGRRSRQISPPGFQVIYRQDMFKYKISVGDTGTYFVSFGLTTAQKESVALTIFMQISMKFEEIQGSFPWSMQTADSSFSEEDLVSDLIGFYTAVRPGTDYMSLCKPVSKEASYRVWDQSGSVGSHKNREFKPRFHPCDECKDTPAFPKELQQIVPASKGAQFRDWQYDVDDKLDGVSPYFLLPLPILIL